MQNLPGGKFSLLLVISIAVALLADALLYLQSGRAKPAIKIGVLHSLTGTMASSETTLVDAVRLAVEEANQSGGVDGQPAEMIVADCRSDAAYCAQQAEKLISQNKVLAPGGIVAVDDDTRHLWKKSYIGKARTDGQFEIVWQSAQPIHPAPFPFYRSHAEWLTMQQALSGAKP